MNRWLTSAIKFHDALHGFWEVWGTENVALEAKLIQPLTTMREAVLFKVLLDLQKSYNALD